MELSIRSNRNRGARGVIVPDGETITSANTYNGVGVERKLADFAVLHTYPHLQPAVISEGLDPEIRRG